MPSAGIHLQRAGNALPALPRAAQQPRHPAAAGNARPELCDDLEFHRHDAGRLAGVLRQRKRPDVAQLARATSDLIAEHNAALRTLAAESYSRVVYLGSNGFKALAREAALKLLELTDGKVVAAFDSPLGFRHGPKTIVTDDTLVFVFVSNDPYTRRYDLDLLRELRSDGQAGRVIAITAQPTGRCRRRPTACACRISPRPATASCIFPTSCAVSCTHSIARLSLGNTPDQPSQLRDGEPRGARRDHSSACERTRLYLGVDGGGTKTALVLIDSDGTIRATHLAPGSYYLTIGLEALEHGARRRRRRRVGQGGGRSR